MKTTDFFNNEYCSLANYDNLRKIASYVDGLKNASRKVIWTVIDKKLYELAKVQHLSMTAAQHTTYLHGSMDGIVVTLARDYLGTNQLPLLEHKGYFGTRMLNAASASRYISAKGSTVLKTLFNDKDVLIEQYFEGAKIEPKFLLPAIPMLLVNGSTGLSFGYSQNILPRKLDDIVTLTKQALIGERPDFDALLPYIAGFNGTVRRVDENTFEFVGNYTVEEYHPNKDYVDVHITEISPFIELNAYAHMLNGLVGKTIRSFKNYSNNDAVKLTIRLDANKVTGGVLASNMLTKLKLVERVTERYVCIDENNKIVEFKCLNDMMQAWVDLRLEYVEKRRIAMLNDMLRTISIITSKIDFIERVENKTIDITECDTAELTRMFESWNLERKKYNETHKSNNIFAALEYYPPVDNSYAYILNMPVSQLTSDKSAELYQTVGKLKDECIELNDTAASSIAIADIETFINAYKKA